MTVTMNGRPQAIQPGERLIDLINRSGIEVPHVCYHPQLGPIQTCDTCMVEVDGKLVRACGTTASEGMNVVTSSPRADAAQREAFDRILGNHLLYCTVCDNNNGNCTVHNTTTLSRSSIRKSRSRRSPTKWTCPIPSIAMIPTNASSADAVFKRVKTSRSMKRSASIGRIAHPRVLWDGGAPIGESSCVSCGHCVTVCPCNALMEKSMLGEAGYLTSLAKPALEGMIDVVKGIEPEVGYGAILQVSEIESHMRESRIKQTKTVCTYCGVGCSFDIWTKDRHILKVEPAEGAANGISTCIKGKFGWEYVNSPDRLTKPLIREGDTFREASWDEALSSGGAQIYRDQGRYRPRFAGLHLFVEMHERRELSDAEAGPRGDRHQQHG